MTGTIKSWRPRGGFATLLSALAAGGVTAAPGVAAADIPDWATQSWYQALQVSVPPAFVQQPTPAVIPRYEALADATGTIGSYQPGGHTVTAGNAFFQSLGTNGRTCFSCHQPQDGWALKPSTVQAAFEASNGQDPVFAAVDGSDCPDLVDEGNAHGHRRKERFVAARQQLFTKANFRIFLTVTPDVPHIEWTLRVVSDPYGCETSATYGIPAGMVSVYRRPLPSANVIDLDPNGDTPRGIFNEGFNIMWDAREPDLESQFNDATLIHAQAGAPPTDQEIVEGVSFQSGLFTAQATDQRAGDLDGANAMGGPTFLSMLTTGISPVPAMNEPPPLQFALFAAWSALTGHGHGAAARESIARGEAIFNSRPFVIADVPGLNDILGNPTQGACGTCHNNQNRGNDFFLDPKRPGIGDNSCAPPNTCNGTSTPDVDRRALPPTPDLPLFSFICPRDSNGKSIIPFFSNPVDARGRPCRGKRCRYDEFLTTDPGLGLITGLCADLGKMKVPVLRGLASRAPFFHGGNAATLEDLVDFYDKRFAIQFTADEKRDLVSFLNAL